MENGNEESKSYESDWINSRTKQQLAFLAQVKAQQGNAEQRRKIEENARRKRREDTKRKKRMLEMAFDGDNNGIEDLIEEVIKRDDLEELSHENIGGILRRRHIYELVECEDIYGNRPLSEAAGGGQAETVKLFLDKGACPNYRGHFNRTALYRAAFAGHLKVIKVLLDHGADPRIAADDGQTPYQISSNDAVTSLLDEWDIEKTDNMLFKLEDQRSIRMRDDRIRREYEIKLMEEEARLAQRESDLRARQKENQGIQGFAGIRYDDDSTNEWLQGKKEDEGEEQEVDESVLPGEKVHYRQLENILIKDPESKIEDSGKWPLLIDPSQRAGTFLRYRDTLYINAMSHVTMQAERIRMSLVGALRFGKGVVLDMRSKDLFNYCAEMFDEVQDGFMKSIMDKSIMTEEKYSKLIRDYDGDDYQLGKFNRMRVSNFRFYIITQTLIPTRELLEKTYPIRVVVDRNDIMP